MKTRTKMMKYSISQSVIALFALLTIGCGKKDDPAPPDIMITVNPTTLVLPSTGGERTFTVMTNADEWSVSTDASWLTANKQGNSVKVEASANTGAARNASIRCMAGTTTATVTVSQAQTTARQRDSIAIVDIHTALGGTSWKQKWNLSSPMNQWYGVKVAPDGKITELDLSENNLSGTMPESLTGLTALEYCDLHGNDLTGVIPADLSKLTRLEFLDLSENSFGGTVPALDALTDLVVLDLSFNDLTVMPSLTGLTSLEYLAFCNNRLNGDLSGDLSALVNLIYLDASNNGFSGVIPASWSSLTRMKVLYLYSNSLEGDIPAWITSFAGMEKLALDDNNLSGDIPVSLGALSRLKNLHLSQNRLTGTIPASLRNNPKWAEWKSEVCPQQASYGFEDCSSTRSITRTGNTHAKNTYKEKYRR